MVNSIGGDNMKIVNKGALRILFPENGHELVNINSGIHSDKVYLGKLDTIDNYIGDINVLEDSIEMYRFKMGLIEKDNERLVESNQRIQRNNTTLINTNNQIINKEREDEKSE